MRTEKNGATIVILNEQGRPYQVWSADIMRCPNCGCMVTAGYGNQPIINGTERMEKTVEYLDNIRKNKGMVVEVKP
jgi:hypothetical protein